MTPKRPWGREGKAMREAGIRAAPRKLIAGPVGVNLALLKTEAIAFNVHAGRWMFLKPQNATSSPVHNLVGKSFKKKRKRRRKKKTKMWCEPTGFGERTRSPKDQV